ncbi:MAG: archease [Candidatus Brockarchaeota archaeon]|nr:archease [Candidatus Brockarchaeota archaeon]
MKPQPGKYDYPEHTSDVYVQAYGRSLEEAFENVALGLTGVMTDVSRINPEQAVEETVEAEDLQMLLYKWLEAILVRLDAEQMVFSVFNVKIEKGGDKYFLKAVMKGERFKPGWHTSGTYVKAVTLHDMEIYESACGARVKVLLDI